LGVTLGHALDDFVERRRRRVVIEEDMHRQQEKCVSVSSDIIGSISRGVPRSKTTARTRELPPGLT
jgi:hypothetical protein